MKCKPGDLAIIINSVILENIGTVVECVSYHKKDDRIIKQNGSMSIASVEGWLVKSINGLSPNVEGYNSIYGIVQDERLMPIRPDELKEDEDIKDLENVH